MVAVGMAVAHHVYDAKLDLSLRINGFNCIRETGEAVYTGDHDVDHTAILQRCQHPQPELGPLGFSDPQAQKLFFAGHIQSQGQINGLVYELFVMAHLN